MPMEMTVAARAWVTRDALIDMIREELADRDLRPDDYTDRNPCFADAEGILLLGMKLGLIAPDAFGLFLKSDLARLPILRGSAENEAQERRDLMTLAHEIASDFLAERGGFITRDVFVDDLLKRRHPLARTRAQAREVFMRLSLDVRHPRPEDRGKV
jgi:hypothetical protein